jgi:hypothetical protein
MIRWLGIAFTCLVVIQPLSAKVEIKNVQASHGPYGPERTSLEIYPLDELFFRFQVTGVKTDPDGKIDGELIIQMKNADGKTVFDQKGSIQRQTMLGGNTFASYAFINIGAKVPPGEYTMLVTFKDRLGADSASFEKKVICKAPTFNIIVPRFYRDGDQKMPGPVGGMVGETMHFRLKAIGLDKSKKQIKTTMTVHILDENGNQIMPKPLVVKAELLNPEEVEKATSATFNGAIVLNRTGDFTLKIIVEDLQGKQTTTFTAPMKVSAP